MKKIITILFAVFLLIPAVNYAQHDGGHSFQMGDNSLEINGYIVAYYQFRPKYAGDNKTSVNNLFAIDDARLSLRGWIHGKIQFHFEYNFAALASWLAADPTTNTVTPFSSPKDQPLTELHFTYRIPYCGIDFKFGYMKIPYALNALSDKLNLAFLERTKFDNSDYNPRRDAGIQLHKDLWHQRINLYGGIFSGMGENIIYGVQDPSGKPEYVGRVELSSGPYKWIEFDKNNKAIPTARVSGGIDYNEKTQFSGDGTAIFSTENVRTIDGKKLSYGGDASFTWHGFSAIFETTRSKMTPHDDAGNGLEVFCTQHHISSLMDGGYYVEANYFLRKYWSGVALKFADEDLTENVTSGPNFQTYNGAQQRTLYMAYVFNVAKYDVQFRFHYAYRFKQPNTGLKWTEDECRVGFVYQW